MHHLRIFLASTFFIATLAFSSCDVPCGEGQLWVTNGVSQTIYLRVEGYYSGYLRAGETVKINVVPDVPIDYQASYGTGSNNFSTDGTITVEDCQTASLELG